MILFLDFDGVTHPECADSDQLFSCTGQLWEILRASPDVQVVFSTSWREIHQPEELLDFTTFGGGENLAHRFIGATPMIVREQGAFIHGQVYKREDECREWLRNNGGVKQPWLALDDTEFWFREQNLYLVNHLTGLTDADVTAIIQRIQSFEPVGNSDRLPPIEPVRNPHRLLFMPGRTSRRLK